MRGRLYRACEVDRVNKTCTLEGLLQRFRADNRTSAIARLYAASVSQPSYRGVHHGHGPTAGDHFLVSQLAYLRGLDCAGGMRVVFLCAERLDQEWATFRQALGLRPTALVAANGSAVPHANARTGEAGSSHPIKRMRDAAKLPLLPESEREFVRHVLYPKDASLHRRVCSSVYALQQATMPGNKNRAEQRRVER